MGQGTKYREPTHEEYERKGYDEYERQADIADMRRDRKWDDATAGVSGKRTHLGPHTRGIISGSVGGASGYSDRPVKTTTITPIKKTGR